MDNTDPYKTKFKEERLYMSTNQNLMQHMRELIDRIKAADVAYYRDDNPTMTDREYDLLVDELKELETTTGLILSGSPTQTVSGEILKELTPVRHTKPMFMSYKFTVLHGGINAGSYELVFDGDLPAQTAEDVFRIFNLEHPSGYRGRSMSVSDIVWMEGLGYWFCDSVGFRQIQFSGEECCWRKFDG